MTLPITSNTVSYVGNNNVNIFNFTYPVFNPGDIVVVISDPNGNGFAPLLNQDYTVAGLNPAGGAATTGYITLINIGQPWLTNGNLTIGWTLTITRQVALVQNTSLRNQGDYYPETIEDAMDYIVMMIQQIAGTVAAAVLTTYVRLYRQPLTGTLDGVNTIFTTPTNFVSGTEEIYVAGILQDAGYGDYTVTGPNQVTFAVAPQPIQAPLRANYNI